MILCLLFIGCESPPIVKGIILNKYTDWSKTNMYFSITCEQSIYIQPINEDAYIRYNVGDTILIDY